MIQKNMANNNESGWGRFSLLAVLALFIIPMLAMNAAALGITPSKQYVDYEANATKDMTLILVNNLHKDLKLLIYASGEYADSIRMNYSIVTMSASEDTMILNYRLKMPSSIEKPGEHSIDLVVMELPSQSENSGDVSVVTSKMALISQIALRVPYPGKYAESSLHISEVQPDEQASFVMPVFNLGKEDIVQASAIVEIFGPTNEILGHAVSERISIASKRQDDLKAYWLANVNPGTYHAVATIDYDGKKIVIEQNFNVGTAILGITDISVGNFKLGDIAKFDISLFNHWNQELKGVYAEFTVTDSAGKINAISKTPSVDIQPFSSAVMNAYWDTSKATVGSYTLGLKTYYAGRTMEKSFNVQVFPDSISIEQLTGRASGSGKNLLSRDTLLVSMVILLIILNIGIISFFNKRKGGGSGPGKTQQSAQNPQQQSQQKQQPPKSEPGSSLSNLMLFFITYISLLFVSAKPSGKGKSIKKHKTIRAAIRKTMARKSRSNGRCRK